MKYLCKAKIRAPVEHKLVVQDLAKYDSGSVKSWSIKFQ